MVLVALALLLGGCATRPLDTLTRPAFQMPKKFDIAGTAPLADDWWRVFDDPGLNQLVSDALEHNFTLASAYARILQAQATVAKQRSNLFPSLTGSANESATRRSGSTDRFSRSGSFGDSAAGLSGTNDASTGFSLDTDRSPWSHREGLGLSASYEVDLFGRVRNGLKADQLSEQASEAALQSAAVSLAGNIASQWYQYQELRARVALIKTQIQTNQHVLELTTFSFNNGQAAAADVLRQRQTVAASRAQLAQARAQVAVARHALAVLVGQGTSDFQPPKGSLVALPPLPATGVPSTTLMQRPDVRQAYYTIASSSASVAVALADRFPQLSLSADYSGDNAASALFSGWILQLGAELTQPIFDAGQRAAEVRRSRAVVDENVADYQQTLLEALQDVDDALVNESQQKIYLKHLDTQLALSKKVVANLRLRYLRGATDYLDVLDALLNRQQLQLDALTGRYDLLNYRINLYRALAGPIPDRPIGHAPDADTDAKTEDRAPAAPTRSDDDRTSAS